MKKLIVLALLTLSFSAFAEFPQLPDPTLTPGAINPEATKDVICVKGYTSGVDKNGAKVRNLSEKTKKQIYKAYKIDPKSGNFEVDHLISLQLGGSNDPKNLWTQSYDSQPYNARMKDGLENTLHALVCKGKVDLSTAQKEVSTNWIEAYKKYVGTK